MKPPGNHRDGLCNQMFSSVSHPLRKHGRKSSRHQPTNRRHPRAEYASQESAHHLKQASLQTSPATLAPKRPSLPIVRAYIQSRVTVVRRSLPITERFANMLAMCTAKSGTALHSDHVLRPLNKGVTGRAFASSTLNQAHPILRA